MSIWEGWYIIIPTKSATAYLKICITI